MPSAWTPLEEAWTLLSARWGLLPLILTVLVLSALAAASWKLRVVTAGGACAGMLLALAIATGLGWRGVAVLGFLVLMGGALTLWGWERKLRRGVAEGRGGRRTARQVLAKGSVAAGCALLALGGWEEFWSLLFCTAVAAGAADTAATEVGKVVAGRTWTLVPPRRVQPGTPGGVSMSGSVAAVLAALLIGAAATLYGLVESEWVMIVVLCGWLATLAESVLHAWLATARRSAPLLANLLTGVLAILLAALASRL